MPRTYPHVPYILWIEYEEIGVTGFVWGGQTIARTLSIIGVERRLLIASVSVSLSLSLSVSLPR